MDLLVGITGKGILVKEKKERKQKIGEKKRKEIRKESFSPETQPLNPKCVV